jgi:CheY-like chemotaxis protein
MVFNDTQEILQLFEQILAGEGYQVSLHSYDMLNLQVVQQIKPDLVISDHPPEVRKEKRGWQLVQALRMSRETAELPVIICTTDVKQAEESEGHLASKGMLVLSKPFDIDELLQAVEDLIGKADSSEPGPFHPTVQNRSKEDQVKRNGSKALSDH